MATMLEPLLPAFLMAGKPARIRRKHLAAWLALAGCVLVSDAGLIAGQVGVRQGDTRQRDDPKPVATSPNGSVSAREPQPRLDRYGDPLPPDAIVRLGTNRFWCGSGMQIVFSSDGGKILVANWGSALVLDAATGRRLRQIRPSGNAGVNSLSLSPDGKLLALGTDSHDANMPSSLQLFDVATGQLLHRCQDTGRQQYLRVRFSPDGKLLASYSYPGKSIHLWNPATGQKLRRWAVNCEGSACFTFSNDSQTLIVGDGKTIHFWDAGSGVEKRQIKGHPGLVYELALSPDGKILASVALRKEPKVGEGYERDNKIHLWDVASGRELRPIVIVAQPGKKVMVLPGEPSDPSEVVHFEFSPDSKLLVTASRDRVLRVWDPQMGQELRHWDANEWVDAFAFTPNGKILAGLGDGMIVRFWNPETGQELLQHPGHRDDFHLLALSTDGRVLASASWDGDVCLWDIATGALVRRLGGRLDGMHALCLSADGQRLTTINEDKIVQLWDVWTGKELRRLSAPFENTARDHAVSADGKVCASACPGDRDVLKAKIVVWDTESGQKLRDLDPEGGLRELAFSVDGRTLNSWGHDQQVRCWEVATGRKLRQFAAGAGQTSSGCFSPTGKWFVCGGQQQSPILYDLAAGKEVLRIDAPRIPELSNLPCFAFAPDERTLALTDAKGATHVWELASGKVRRHLTGGHLGDINALTFSTDGQRLVSGSADTSALVWDLIGRTSARHVPIQPADVETCWTELAGADAVRAYQAMCRLIASPTEAIPCLRTHLERAVAPDAHRLAELIANLDSSRFATREAAMKELMKLEEQAAPALRSALAQPLSAEARRRLEQLLARLQPIGAPAELLRQGRALEVLENIGTPEARLLLARLADGAPAARLTREARAALDRLTKRAGTELPPGQ